jgi:hypothetical protein
MGVKTTLQTSGISPERVMSLVRSLEEMGMEVELVSAPQGQTMGMDDLDGDLEDQMFRLEAQKQYEAQLEQARREEHEAQMEYEAQMELEAQIAEARRRELVMIGSVLAACT